MNEFDKMTATEVRTIIAVLGFSFIMGFTFGDGSLGFTLMVGLLGLPWYICVAIQQRTLKWTESNDYNG